MIDPKEFVQLLNAQDVDYFCGVPDSLLKELCSCVVGELPANRRLTCANEGNAVGVASGWHLATGHAACVYLQNSGEGNAVNPLLSIADPDVYSIPMLLVIGWRGEPGVHDEPQHVKQGKVTLKLLEAMDVPYVVLDAEGEAWRTQVATLLQTMRTEERPVAVVVRKNTFAPYPSASLPKCFQMSREEALEVVLDELGEDDLVVSTTGKTSREVFEIRERRGQGHANDFLTVGGMGHTSSIALGLALGQDRDVWCLDGDGSFLMHMGAFPVIAEVAPANFHYVLNNNGAHESVGGQPTVALDIDVPTILAAAGFELVIEASTPGEVAAGMEALRAAPKRALVIYTDPGSRDDLGRPTTTPQQNKRAMRALIEGKGGEA